MIAFLYRWRIKTGYETQFISAWAEVTRHHRENSGSLGSRLHRGNDGLFYGYACWPSAETRQNALSRAVELPARARMAEAIEESLPETQLDIELDLIVPSSN